MFDCTAAIRVVLVLFLQTARSSSALSSFGQVHSDKLEMKTLGR